MFKDDYGKELDSITVSEKFKTDTISLMYAKQNEPTKTVKFAKSKYAMIAASIAVMLMVAGVHLMGKSDYFITADSAIEEYSRSFENKEADTDSLPFAGAQLPFMRVYSINDATPLCSPDENAKEKTKLYFDGRNNGGMGFEGYMFYSPYQLEQNQAYSTGDEFDTLPVYQCITLSAGEKAEYIDQYIKQLGFKRIELKYEWLKPVYDENGIHTANDSITTEDAACPQNGFILFSVIGNLINKDGTLAELWRWPTGNSVGIMIDSIFAESENIYDVADSAFEKYPAILNQNTMDVHSWFHYNIYGELTYDLYAYEKSDDYGENLFNSTLNNISFSQYKHYEEDAQPTRSSFHFTLPAYNKVTDLPAIDYKQALELFYSGNFYTTYSDQINEDTIVSHIEIVYRSPDYDMATKIKTGYALPFYKFYVQLDDSYNRETPDGILQTYAAYYVCAIHPDYVELDESYFHFY